MKVFKFGGASVKDAEAIKNVGKVLQKEGTSNLVVVISAMGKMTNAFEDVVEAYFDSSKNLKDKIKFIKNYHENVCSKLNVSTEKISEKTDVLFKELDSFIDKNSSLNYNFVYDQIVSFGELLSTTIISCYLTEIGIDNTWLDVRNYVTTDATYRDAKIDWETTTQKITKINTKTLNITQGFLGGNQNHTTTLGREGSDYTAGIFAYCLNAENVTIWKDVKGVLNADPRVFNDTELLKEISYTEAIEMAFYGASVIHPKTIQPLEQKNIPLFVRSFINSNEQGTRVSNSDGITPKVPCFIVKKHQTLISIAAKNFSFIVEDNISFVFKKLHEHQLKVNLIQNSAISFSVCVDDKFENFANFCAELQSEFNIRTYHNVSLFTIRHFDNASLTLIQKKGKAVIKQIGTNTAQLVIQEN